MVLRKSFPIQEDSPLKGAHPYDVSKTCADLIASSLFNYLSAPGVLLPAAGTFMEEGISILIDWCVEPSGLSSITSR